MHRRRCYSSKGSSSYIQLLKPGVKIYSKIVHIDSLILFTRLTALIQRDRRVEQNFKYELTPEQATLFRNGMMGKVKS